MQQTDTATGALRREHQLILLVVDTLERLAERAATAPPPLRDLEDCVTFFRLFTDACHHGKEEDLLFAELEAQGMPREYGPIGVMLAEHRMGREFVRAMAAALARMREGDAAAWPRFETVARDYVHLLRRHIAKEDGILFEMADQLVSGSACESLCERYAEACSRRFEGRTLEDLERLAHRLEQRGR